MRNDHQHMPRSRHAAFIPSIFLALAMFSPLRAQDAPPATEASRLALTVVATTSMLAAAVTDLRLPPGAVSVTTLIPPGACPGHFDVSPGLLPVLRRTELVVRHDYQEALAAAIARLAGDEVRTVAVPTGGSLLIPPNYAALVARVADTLAARRPELTPALTAGRTTVATRMSELDGTLRQRAAPWRGAPVIASVMQREFCEWLGFKVVGLLPRPEDMSPRDLGALARAGAAIVIGNAPSDGAAARTLGQRLKLPVAVLGNFPEDKGEHAGYVGLSEANMAELERAWSSRN